ncbi:MAG: FtsL-like putative cell division protein [Mangrovibacterium sp.]
MSRKEQPAEGNGKPRRNRLRSFLGGNLLASEKMLRHLPLVFFLVILGILLITNRYWAQRTIRQIEAVQDSIKELKAESVTYETELMRMCRPSEIAERVRESGLNLQELQEPPRKLKVQKLKKSEHPGKKQPFVSGAEP